MDDFPVYLTPMVSAWRCRMRGMCCRNQRVQFDEVERRRLERVLVAAGDPLAERFAAERIERAGDWPLLPSVDDHCVFLGADNLCKLRQRFGMAPLPGACQKFPYLSIHTGERQLVDLTFQCPTALQLLAEETRFEVQVVSEAPLERVAWLGNADRPCFGLAGEPITVAAFWQLHWSLFERFAERPEANPLERLMAFMQEVSGQAAPPPVRISEAQLRQGAFAMEVLQELERVVGEVPKGLLWLWTEQAPQSFTLDPLPALDEDALLLRYLLHRFFCPVAYLWTTDPRFLLATLFASLARYRVERARGNDLLTAIRNLDRFFVHSPDAAGLIGSESTFSSWRAMAALARAETFA